MANYLMVYTGGGMPESEEEGAKVMAAWGAWYGSMGEALVDGGNPINPGGKSIHGNGSVMDSPVGTHATGYTVIKANSMDAALEIAKGCPNLTSGGEVSVYETFEIEM